MLADTAQSPAAYQARRVFANCTGRPGIVARRLRALAGLVVVLALALPGAPATLAAPVSPAADVLDRYVVVLRDGADAPAVAQQHANAHGLAVSHVYQHALAGYAARIPAVAVDHIRADPRVLYVAPDGTASATAQTLPTGIDRIDGEQSKHYASNVWATGFGVAVIDTGVGPHADLNVAGGTNCVRATTDTSYADWQGHGTHVAGTIGAMNNAAGVVGVAPGVPIYSVRALGADGQGTWSDVICGIDWVTANAATIKVANMSLGDTGTSTTSNPDCTNGEADSSATKAVHTAICNSAKAGVTYAAAAGNNSADVATFVPAAYAEVLAVTAMGDANGKPGGKGSWGSNCAFGDRLLEKDDRYASFSNYALPGDPAQVSHTIAAPGVCIYSTAMGGGYTTKSGTSMAAPHAAGTVALCLASACAGLSPADVIAKIRADAATYNNTTSTGYGFTGDPRRPVSGKYYGYLLRAGSY